MFLGIKFNTWHFLIPFVVLVIAIPFIFLNLDPFIGVLWLAGTLMGLTAIQFWYEWHQLTDPLCPEIYGSYEGFIKDSKDDIRKFIIGCGLGIFAGFVLFVIINLVR